MQVFNTLSKVRQLRRAVAGICLLFAWPLSASAADLMQYELRSLDQAATEHTLDRYRGTPTLMIFFEPECAWCLRQIRVLNKLIDECENFQALAIGANGSRSALRDTLNRMRPDFPSYQISRELEADIGKVETTPLMLIADEQGEFVTYMRGYQKEEILVPALQDFIPGYCD